MILHLASIIIFILTHRELKKPLSNANEETRKKIFIANIMGIVLQVIASFISYLVIAFVQLALYGDKVLSFSMIITLAASILFILAGILFIICHIRYIKKLSALKKLIIVNSICYCDNCGTALPAGTTFCTNCGAAIVQKKSELEEVLPV